MKNTVTVIGKTNGGFGYEVRYNKEQELVICIGANVIVYNVKSLEQAYDVSDRNFRNFVRI